MKKIITGASAILGTLAALPALAGSLGATLNMGLNYRTIVGWASADLRAIIMRIINILMGFLGVIAIIIVLYGGFKWMTAGGNEDQVGEAKKMIIAGVVGLAIVIAAYAIAAFVVQQLVGAVQ